MIRWLIWVCDKLVQFIQSTNLGKLLHCIFNFSTKQDLAFLSLIVFLHFIPRCHPFIRNDCGFHDYWESWFVRPACEDGSLRFSSKVLSCLWEENVSFLSFLPLSPWVLQYEWENYKFGFYPHSCFPSFILHLKVIAGQLYPGPSLGVLTQESDKLRASMIFD